MIQKFFYCSAVSLEAGEQSIGTASTGEVWLLLEYAQAWGTRAFQESNLSRPLKIHLNRMLKTIPRSRLLLIKQDRQPQDQLTLFIVRSLESDTSITKLKLENYEQLLSLTVEQIAAGNYGAGAETLSDSLYLVCTHGKRDKCCAKFGYALYKSLRAVAGTRVWQSSHVGGDRFAANLICFPHGLFYAHVTEESGQQLVNEYEEGRLSLDNYRGRACYPSPIQAAEFFVRSQSGLMGVGDLRFLDYHSIRERNWRVRFVAPLNGTVHEVYLTSRLSEFQNLLTCQATEEKRVVQYSFNDYRVTGGNPSL
ncbi:MAG: sucrase ferredoxin [Pyrinomonadaceae bacterium]